MCFLNRIWSLSDILFSIIQAATWIADFFRLVSEATLLSKRTRIDSELEGELSFNISVIALIWKRVTSKNSRKKSANQVIASKIEIKKSSEDAIKLMTLQVHSCLMVHHFSLMKTTTEALQKRHQQAPIKSCPITRGVPVLKPSLIHFHYWTLCSHLC